MDELTLKPCPFCGHEASMTNVESAAPDRHVWVVGCNSEDCDVSFHGHARKVDAANAWNHRSLGEWTAIRTADDLPKEFNWYEVTVIDTTDLGTVRYVDILSWGHTAEVGPCWTNLKRGIVIAYRDRPEPYQSKTDEM